MVDQTPTVQNRGPLIIALVLAALVAIAFNVFVEAVRNEKSEMVRVLQYTGTLRAGQEVTADDVEIMEVAAETFKTIGDLVRADEAKVLIFNKQLVRSVHSGKVVSLKDVGAEMGEANDAAINEGMAAVSIEIGRDASPGQILTPEGRINLIAPFSIGGTTKYYPIIENVRVLGVGGSARSMSSDAVQRDPTNYRTVTVELEPVVCRQLLTVLSHARGPIMVEVVNRTEQDVSRGGKITRDLVNAGFTEKMGNASTRGTREVTGGNMGL
jgi:Flp pilus assembly protein CpaB